MQLDCGLPVSFKRTTKLCHTLSSPQKRQRHPLELGHSLFFQTLNQGMSHDLRLMSALGRGWSTHFDVSTSTRNTLFLLSALLQVPTVAGGDVENFIDPQKEFVSYSINTLCGVSAMCWSQLSRNSLHLHEINRVAGRGKTIWNILLNVNVCLCTRRKIKLPQAAHSQDPTPKGQHTHNVQTSATPEEAPLVHPYLAQTIIF